MAEQSQDQVHRRTEEPERCETCNGPEQRDLVVIDRGSVGCGTGCEEVCPDLGSEENDEGHVGTEIELFGKETSQSSRDKDEEVKRRRDARVAGARERRGGYEGDGESSVSDSGCAIRSAARAGVHSQYSFEP